ncbi:tyrosine recombinase XerC [Catellatospora aurea]|uniref:Tyrosine recombinase XerC n=1 Tax=Catellatospora aurea TaxID=1337874 RepID=A0ABW2H0P7_9ACTN
MTSADSSARPEIEAALLLLGKLGLTPADLVSSSAAGRPAVPTFAEFIPEVAAAVTPGTLKTYGSYWAKVAELWGDRKIDSPTALELEQLGEAIKAKRTVRSSDRGGRSALENYVGAMRCLYRRAVDCDLILVSQNPAAKIKKPRRLPSNRRALPDARLQEITAVAANGGDDPALDALLIRFHTETGARRAGALAVRPMDLDMVQCLVRLREKGGTEDWQPVSPTLMAHLWDHGVERGAPQGGQLLRYRNGRPITYRRYDGLWVRVREVLPWAAAQGVSTHWLRHTILTWVERNFGTAVARAFARHTDKAAEQKSGSTATYVKADIHEVARAVAALTGEPHPLENP